MNTTTIDPSGTIVSDPLQETARHALAAAGHGHVVHQQQQHQPTTPGYLLQLAVQQGADMEKLERLMALQERWEAAEAKRAFVAAMAEFKAEPMTIFKTKQVGYTTKEGDFVGYTHATLADVTDVVVPAMGRHGLSHRWDIRQEGGRIHVSCVVTHRLGHSETVVMDCPPDSSGKKNPLQQIASATSYLQRYTLLAVTGMATKDLDNDGADAGGDDDEPAENGPRATSPRPPAPPPAAPPEYTDDEFAEKLPTWVDQLTIPNEKTGKCVDPERLIAFVESKGKRFTQAQNDKLTSYKPPF